jgi:OmpA-OmpF porin, OOP family
MKQLSALAVIFLSAFALSAQNLIPNPGFEEKAYCPSSFNEHQLKVVTGWSQVNEGTPDYFHSCSKKVGVPSNIFGNQSAHGGEAYCGMAIYSPGQRNYREYLVSKLDRPLNAGEMVCIELYVSSADDCKYVVDGFGAVLSKEKLKQDRSLLIPHEPAIQNPRLHMLDEADGWVLLGDVYTAQGGEEYLTIGNFKADKNLKVIRRTRIENPDANGKWAYLYIDDVSVKPVRSKSECSCENEYLASIVVDPPLELYEYDDIKLDAVLFDFDEDVLTSDARKQLDEIYTLMKKNRSMFMEIDGHTDAIGNDRYNLGLSDRRAERVISYLVNKGIERDRFSKSSFGSEQPVAPNDNDEGRAQNRRVEFHIRQKRFELVQ